MEVFKNVTTFEFKLPNGWRKSINRTRRWRFIRRLLRCSRFRIKAIHLRLLERQKGRLSAEFPRKLPSKLEIGPAQQKVGYTSIMLLRVVLVVVQIKTASSICRPCHDYPSKSVLFHPNSLCHNNNRWLPPRNLQVILVALESLGRIVLLPAPGTVPATYASCLDSDGLNRLRLRLLAPAASTATPRCHRLVVCLGRRREGKQSSQGFHLLGQQRYRG